MTIQFPAHAARRPVATYRAVSSRDASSAARDGEPVFEVRRLDSTSGHADAEVRFADNAWQLADVARDLTPGFAFDEFDDHVFLAQDYGDAWNGWDTPVVTREVLGDILLSLEMPHRWDGDVAVLEVEDYEDRIEPRQDGFYDLRQTGWTVLRIAT
ncbi:hypothetical protein M3C60_006210 [Micrococcus luteus]|nr:hypothetical protein [Micrococcus luteus]MCV7467120.1 hypothetical protein [Micrococcus luteus]